MNYRFDGYDIFVVSGYEDLSDKLISQAEQLEIVLLYSPLSTGDDRYFVPAGCASQFHTLAEKQTPPSDIIKHLGLNRVSGTDIGGIIYRLERIKIEKEKELKSRAHSYQSHRVVTIEPCFINPGSVPRYAVLDNSRFASKIKAHRQLRRR